MQSFWTAGQEVDQRSTGSRVLAVWNPRASAAVTASACDGRGGAEEKEPSQEEGPVESETLV